MKPVPSSSNPKPARQWQRRQTTPEEEKSGGIGGKAWKSFMSKLYGWGAAIVIVGALFKIEHWEGASEMLIIGLGN